MVLCIHTSPDMMMNINHIFTLSATTNYHTRQPDKRKTSICYSFYAQYINFAQCWQKIDGLHS